MITDRRESGFALLAALLACAGFALLATEIIAVSRTGLATANAYAAQARMSAQADAGLALAQAALEAPESGLRWGLGGDYHRLTFDGATLTVRVEDEWGKIPLNTLPADKVRLLFQRAGAPDAALDGLVEGFHAARHDLGSPGAEPGRGPGFDNLSDLLRIPGVSPMLYATIAPSVSIVVRDAAFEPRTASPLALEVMTGAAPDGPEVLQRRRELAGDVPVVSSTAPLRLAGRPLTLRVIVSDLGGARFEKAVVVEATHAPARPYINRGLVATTAGYP